MPPLSAYFLAKRPMGFLAGGLAIAAALGWFISRRRVMKALQQAEADEAKKNALLERSPCEGALDGNKTQFSENNGDVGSSSGPKTRMDQDVNDSGGGGGSKQTSVTSLTGHHSDHNITSDNDLEKKECKESRSNSPSSCSPLTSEHSGDAEAIPIDEEKHINENVVEVCGTSPSQHLLNLEMDECPFDWSEEVEMSARKKLLEQANRSAAGDCEPSSANVVTSNGGGYKLAESPGTHSEGSQDSGRATGGLASSMSPADDAAHDNTYRPMYEFEIPNSLVGLIIGIKGKTIKELCTRTDVKMIIRPHHTHSKMSTHQICMVEGPRDNINKCLQMLRRRFPASRFPELNLRPVLPPPIPSPAAELFGTQPTQLTLPEGVRSEVFVSAIVDAGHFFVQQPTHPSFSSLHRLDHYMLIIYSQTTGIPDLPKPCETGLLCVAPASGGWYRAVTVLYYEDQDEVLVRFVDYGGYSRIPRADLRQIRTDFMTLPFQAVECYIAHVEPVDGTQTWSEAAIQVFHSLVMGRFLGAFVVGYNVADQTPTVELFYSDENNKESRVDLALLNEGLAKAADPSKVKHVLPKPMLSPAGGDGVASTGCVTPVNGTTQEQP